MSIVLPSGMCREQTVCFTGHRIFAAAHRDTLPSACLRTVRILAESGYRWFLCGGALGFDTLAAQTVLTLRETVPEVQLVLVLPCRDQDDRWAEHDRAVYADILARADAVLCLHDTYTDGCMRERNLFMIDHASFCVTYFNGFGRSGTAQTVRLARKAGLSLYNLCDGSAEKGRLSDS